MTKEEALIAMIKGERISNNKSSSGNYIFYNEYQHKFQFYSERLDQKSDINGCLSCDSGYEILKETKTITIDGKDIEISEESFEALKKQLLE